MRGDTQNHTDTYSVCVSCDDIVRLCSLGRSQERDLQMRSSWTSEMKYSSVLIRGWTLTEHSYLWQNRNTAMRGRAHWHHTHTNKLLDFFFLPKGNTSIYTLLHSSEYSQVVFSGSSDALNHLEIETGWTISTQAFTVVKGIISATEWET